LQPPDWLRQAAGNTYNIAPEQDPYKSVCSTIAKPPSPIVPMKTDLTNEERTTKPSDTELFNKLSLGNNSAQHKLDCQTLIDQLDTTYHKHSHPDFNMGDHGSLDPSNSHLDDRPIMQPILPVFVTSDTYNHAYTTGINSAMDAIVSRITDINKDDATLTLESIKPVLDTIKLVFALQFPVKYTPADYDRVVAEFTTPNQLKRVRNYDQNHEADSSLDGYSNNGSFVKAETANKATIMSRNITNLNDDLIINQSAYTIIASNTLKTFVEGYLFQYNNQQLGELLHLKCIMFKTVVASDYSKFDGHQNYATRLIEKLFFATIFIDAQPMFDMMDAANTSTYKAHDDITYTPGYTRLSGSAETSLGNTLDNLTMSVVSRLYHSRQKPYTETLTDLTKSEVNQAFNMMMAGGDDGIAFDINLDRYQELVNLFRLKITLESVNTTDKPITLLSRIYPAPRASPASGINFERFLSKLSFGVLNSSLSFIDKITAKLMGYIVTENGNNPLITSFLAKMISLYGSKARTHIRIEPRDLPYTTFMGQPTPIPHYLLDVYYAQQNPLYVEMMTEIVNNIDTIDQLQTYVNDFRSREQVLNPKPNTQAVINFDKRQIDLHPEYKSALPPQDLAMCAYKSTCDSIIELLGNIIEPDKWVIIDTTVGPGALAQRLTSLKQFHLDVLTVDMAEINHYKTLPHYPRVLDEVIDGATYNRDVTKRAVIIIDLPFKLYSELELAIDNNIAALTVMKFDPNKDWFIINAPVGASAPLINKLNKQYYNGYINKDIKRFTRGRIAGIITNITKPRGKNKFNPLSFSATSRDANVADNLAANRYANPNPIPLTSQEARSESKRLSTRKQRVVIPPAPASVLLALRANLTRKRK